MCTKLKYLDNVTLPPVISFANIEELATLSRPITDVEVINGWYADRSMLKLFVGEKLKGRLHVIASCLVYVKWV